MGTDPREGDGAGDDWRPFARVPHSLLPRLAKLSSAQVAVLLGVIALGNYQRGETDASPELLAKLLGLEPDTVAEALASLIAHGLLRLDQHGNRPVLRVVIPAQPNGPSLQQQARERVRSAGRSTRLTLKRARGIERRVKRLRLKCAPADPDLNLQIKKEGPPAGTFAQGPGGAGKPPKSPPTDFNAWESPHSRTFVGGEKKDSETT